MQHFCLKWYLCLSQTSFERVTRVAFSSQALQVSFQPFFGLSDILQQFGGFCARFHRLREIRRLKGKLVDPWADFLKHLDQTFALKL